MSGIFFYSRQKDVFSHTVSKKDIRMKNSYLAYPLLILLAACGQKAPDAAYIEGEITGLGDDTIYVYGADKLHDRMDTLFVEKNKFSASLSPDTLVATWMLFSDGTQYPLFLEKGNQITIKGNAAELNSLTISGNMPNEELTAFQEELKGLGQPSEKVLENKAEEFIKAHHSSLVSIYLLDKYFVQKSQPNYTQIKRLIDSMTGELQDRPYIDNLLDRIEEENKTANGKAIPHFQLPNAEGKQISRTNFKDKYLLVHFWASWDTTSRDSNAVYRRIYKKEKKNELFGMLGISLDIDKNRWEQAVRNDTLQWEQVCNFSGWSTSIVEQLGIRALPANILINPSGKIEGKNMSGDKIEKKIKDIEEKEKAKKERKEKKEREKKKKR